MPFIIDSVRENMFNEATVPHNREYFYIILCVVEQGYDTS